MQNNKKIKILVTGGGSGGHVVPLMAVVTELKKYTDKILFVGSGLEMEKRIANSENVEYKSVLSGKLRRYFSWQNFIDPFKVIIGFFQAIFIILFFRPNVIFAKGGYVTIPVAFAGWLLWIPIVTHESDVVMGLSNRLEKGLAKKICVGFPISSYIDLPLDKVVFTGNPVKKEFVADGKISPIEHKSIIFVTGGSQGARFINQTIASLLNDLTKKYYIIHITGKNDYEWIKKNSWPNYELYDFTNKVPELMKKSDLVISRPGANFLAEISFLGKPSILITPANSANGHQLANAKVYEKNGAAIVLSEEGLTPTSLEDIIDRLMEDKKMLKDIGVKAKELSQPEASKAIADEIIKIVK